MGLSDEVRAAELVARDDGFGERIAEVLAGVEGIAGVGGGEAVEAWSCQKVAGHREGGDALAIEGCGAEGGDAGIWGIEEGHGAGGRAAGGEDRSRRG